MPNYSGEYDQNIGLSQLSLYADPSLIQIKKSDFMLPWLSPSTLTEASGREKKLGIMYYSSPRSPRFNAKSTL